MNTNSIKVLLESLVKLDKPLDIIKHEIQQNAEQLVDIQDMVELYKIDVVNVMKVFLDKRISSDDLSVWAELVEGRDGIQYEEEFQKVIADVLFWLSSPDINGELTNEKVKEYLDYLL